MNALIVAVKFSTVREKRRNFNFLHENVILWEQIAVHNNKEVPSGAIIGNLDMHGGNSANYCSGTCG